MSEEKVVLSAVEASKVAGVSRMSIYNWVREGRVVATDEGHLRVYRDSLLRCMEERAAWKQLCSERKARREGR